MYKLATLVILATTISGASAQSSTNKYSDKYYSQFGQDEYLNENHFHNKRDGVYVDIGAYDGITISNSYYFANLGWKGICIEPLPNVYQTLVKNRPTSICLNYCVSDVTGPVEFLHVQTVTDLSQMLSGIEKNYRDHRHSLDNHFETYPGHIDTIIVNSRTINDILEEYKFNKIDFLSIDTEGADFVILKSIDYDKYKIHFITIENNYGDPEVRKFMETKGFKLIKVLQVDEIYQNMNFH